MADQEVFQAVLQLQEQIEVIQQQLQQLGLQVNQQGDQAGQQAAQAAQVAAQAVQAAHAAVQAQEQATMAAAAAVAVPAQIQAQAEAVLGAAAEQVAIATAAAGQATAAVGQAAAGPVAAPATAATPTAVAGASGSKVKVPYTKLSLLDNSSHLNMTLDNWFTATRASFAVNNVPQAEEVQVAVLAAMQGHVQAVCLEMFRANMLPSWEALATELQRNFSQQDRQQAAAAMLEKLTMKNSSKAALETYISKSRSLHLAAGLEVPDLQRYRYFMRGMESQLRELVGGLIASQEHPQTFEFASNLALKIVANRVEQSTVSANTSGPMPMEVVSAMARQRGWAPPQNRGAPLQRRGRWQNQSGPPGGSRVHKAAKGKGRVPGTWQPKMSNPARRALMDAGLCLCCKESTEHTWRDCPRNPDNRGNA